MAALGVKEATMKKVSTLAAVMLVGTVMTAYAQTSPGASGSSPGHEMKQPSTKSGTKGPGASSYAPGQKQTTPGSASEMSPGDKMNDKRSR